MAPGAALSAADHSIDGHGKISSGKTNFLFKNPNSLLLMFVVCTHTLWIPPPSFTKQDWKRIQETPKNEPRWEYRSDKTIL